MNIVPAQKMAHVAQKRKRELWAIEARRDFECITIDRKRFNEMISEASVERGERCLSHFTFTCSIQKCIKKTIKDYETNGYSFTFESINDPNVLGGIIQSYEITW